MNATTMFIIIMGIYLGITLKVYVYYRITNYYEMKESDIDIAKDTVPYMLLSIIWPISVPVYILFKMGIKK